MPVDDLQKLIDEISSDLAKKGLLKPGSLPVEPDRLPISTPDHVGQPGGGEKTADLVVDLADVASQENRMASGIHSAQDAEGVRALMETTTARIGVGRAGARYRTPTWLLFLADHAITQDALFREVDETWLAAMELFSVQTCISTGKQEYLLRPDLGRKLSSEANRLLQERCVRQPDIQICIGDGLSASAIESNLAKMMPVLQNGFQTAGLRLGTPFFIRYCRVGVMNDIGDIIQPDVLILLIGERPGLGRANSMSAYMAYRPGAGHTDADRDVICNIYDAGGTNPLEAGAYVVQLAQKMLFHKASGIKLRLLESEKG